MKQFFTLFFVLMASTSMLFAESGTCGENLTWTLDENGLLTISGTGAMTDYTWENPAPWYESRVSIKSIVLSNSVTSIGEWTFYYCTNLTSIEIPNSVTSIGDYAFFDCTGLTSLEIPSSVTSIGGFALEAVPNVIYTGTAKGSPWQARSVNGFVDGYLVYNDNTKTKLLACSTAATGEISIPNSVTNIKGNAFLECIGMTSVIIPNSVTNIEWLAFQNCSGLTSIVVDGNNTTYDSRNNCNAIIETATNTLIQGCKNTIIPNSVTCIKNCAFKACSGLTSIEIPNSITSIEESAFSYCTSLTSVFIPHTVTSIGVAAFSGCTSLTSIVVDGNNTTYDCRNNCNAIIETATNTLIAGCKKTIIPNSVTSIGEKAFYYCTGLTSVTIPNSVTSIGSLAFSDCTGLTSVTIPNTVTSIGSQAFYNCTGLTSVTIPSNVTSIEVETFNYCTGLTSITCESVNPPSCKYNALLGVSRSIPLYVPANSVSVYKKTAPWSEWGDNIKPIQAAETEVIEPQAKPTESSVVIEWPKADGAAIYTITIKKGDEPICTLSFNEQGQLLSIAFAAPARNRSSHQTQAAQQTTTGWQYTISGLEPNTDYTYTVIAKSSDDTPIYTKPGSFKTQETATSLDQTSQEPIANSQKLLINGQILILRGSHTYTLTGQEVK